MRVLYLVRHSLTEANERRLYYGWTDLPLSGAGRALALEAAAKHPLPACDLYVTSGMRRADETLGLLAGRKPDAALPELKEMNFGAFEMRGYPELKDDPDYRRWIDDLLNSGDARCPGGESPAEFHSRVLRGGEALLALDWNAALAVVHGGTIANLMSAWFPEAGQGFYEWQPGPCGGWRVNFKGTAPLSFDAMQED